STARTAPSGAVSWPITRTNGAYTRPGTASGGGSVGKPGVVGRASATPPALFALRAREVLARLGVDADQVALADEVRHGDDEPGLGLRGLQHVRDRGGLEAGRGLHDPQVDRLRQAHAHRPALVELDLDARVRDQVLDGVAEYLLVERDLLV